MQLSYAALHPHQPRECSGHLSNQVRIVAYDKLAKAQQHQHINWCMSGLGHITVSRRRPNRPDLTWTRLRQSKADELITISQAWWEHVQRTLLPVVVTTEVERQRLNVSTYINDHGQTSMWTRTIPLTLTPQIERSKTCKRDHNNNMIQWYIHTAPKRAHHRKGGFWFE